MARRTHRFSLLSQSLDRTAFIAYFLGAVVPLVALAYVVQRFALPALPEDVGEIAILGLLMSIGVLSLGSFFLLRRMTLQALRMMDADNRRLKALIQLSEELAAAIHGGEVAKGVVNCAIQLSSADAAYVFLRGEKPGDPAIAIEHAGEGCEPTYQRARMVIDSLVKLAMSNRRPAVAGADGAQAKETGIHAAAAVPLSSSEGCLGAIAVVLAKKRSAFEPSQVSSLSTLAGLAAVALHNADLRDAQKNFFAHVTDVLVSALDSYLEVQIGHSRRVAHFANVMARKLGFDDERLQRLHFASLLHDIGMLRIPKAHKSNPTACRKHPVLGARMLERIRLWEDIAPFVLHHHEWWNGEGYPDGLAGERIPLEARIIGIAEAFDSMTSTSSYKEAVPVEEALRRIEDCAGGQFDPEVSRVFLSLVNEGTIRIEED